MKAKVVNKLTVTMRVIWVKFPVAIKQMVKVYQKKGDIEELEKNTNPISSNQTP